MTNVSDDLDLLNVFAHDLKVPLNAIRGYLQLIEAKGPLNSEQDYYHGRAFAAIERAETMIREMLTYARLEASTISQTQPCNLAALVEDVVLMLETSALERDIRLHVTVKPQLERVGGDEAMLRHALTNLVGNAIKYNREGGAVWISAHGDVSDVVLIIRDSGVGIKPEHLPRIFEQFYRVDAENNGTVRGAGLGLAIVKTVIDKHGGSIDVQSTYGSGTTFTVRLPIAIQAPDAEAGVYSAGEPLDGVDDNLQEPPEHPDSDSLRDNV